MQAAKEAGQEYVLLKSDEKEISLCSLSVKLVGLIEFPPASSAT